MISTNDVLRASGVHYSAFGTTLEGKIQITAGNQLLAGYQDMKSYQATAPDYSGWHAHHIVETFDLDRLGIAPKFPDRDSQLTVLLPERAHIGRINSILRVENPVRLSATSGELLPAYKRAYELVGDYCGGGARNIQTELMSIVTATFRLAGVPHR